MTTVVVILACVLFPIVLIAVVLGIFFGGIYLIAIINELSEKKKGLTHLWCVIPIILILTYVSMNAAISFADKFI